MADKKKAEESLSKLLTMLESGDLPEAIARSEIARQHTDAPFSQWSLGNQILMICSDTLDARGFRQWEKVNRKVKKGVKAFYILGPKARKITDEDEERTIATGFVAVPVFRYEDTEGEEIEYPDYAPLELPPLHEVAEAMGVDVKYVPFTKGSYGYYSPSNDKIRLASYDRAVFWHELAHAAHDRATPGGCMGGQQPEQEVVAETVAATLCLMYDQAEYVTTCKEYIERYGQGEKAGRAIMRVLSQVRATLDVIFEVAQERAMA